MGDGTGGFTALVIVRASLCAHWAVMSRCKSIMNVRAERVHLHFVRSDLGTVRTQFVVDMMQYISAAGM